MMHKTIIVLVTTFSFCSATNYSFTRKKTESRNLIGEFMGKVWIEMMVSSV